MEYIVKRATQKEGQLVTDFLTDYGFSEEYRFVTVFDSPQKAQQAFLKAKTDDNTFYQVTEIADRSGIYCKTFSELLVRYGLTAYRVSKMFHIAKETTTSWAKEEGSPGQRNIQPYTLNLMEEVLIYRSRESNANLNG